MATTADEPEESFGAFVRARRQLDRLSLRQLADRAQMSNAYLSQLERGLHKPSLAVVQSLADALGISISTLLRSAGMRLDPHSHTTTDAILNDDRLSEQQRNALVEMYRSMVGDAVTS